MEENKKKIIISLIGVIMITIFGISYAFFDYSKIGTSNNEIIAGTLYMDYTDTNEITLMNIYPMTKEDALLSTNNVFNFTITGKNTSSKDIFYGISLINGDEIEGKKRFNPQDIMVYLTCDDVVLLDGVRYSEWRDDKIWIDTIDKNTNDNITKNYTLRIWIDESVKISDTLLGANYTTGEWNNSYLSVKINVDGNLNNMSMPLTILTNDSYVENGKSYFLVRFSNYTDLRQEGNSVSPSDRMNLKIESTGNNTEFSYTDDEGNTVTTLSDSLDLNYVFATNKTVEIKVYITPKNDANSNNDIKIRLSKNSNVIQELTKRIYVKGNNYCLNNGFNKLKDCILVMDSQATNVANAISSVESKGQVDVNNTAPLYVSGVANGGDLGLYAQEDDYGTSYFYRGAVTNNNVKFAGFYWKIIRINGDGSIRLIYNGSTSNATGNVTSINEIPYAYNSKYPDPTYVGYMYGDNLVSQESLETNYNGINATTSYVFAKNYDIVPGTTNYVLRDNPDDATDTITKKFSEMNAMMEDGGTDNFFTLYPYTCMETSSSTQCQVIIKVSSYNEASNYVKASYISFSSTSADNTGLNNVSSNIKTQLETWYQNNILNKNDQNGNSYSKYVADAIFCNDRSMPNTSYNSGYLRNIHTYYGGYQRLAIDAVKTAKLTCNGDIRDMFSATNTKGNGLLTYPVGLITADETSLAGMKYGSENANPNNYLTTGGNFLTMTPSIFTSTYAAASVIYMDPTGYLGLFGVNYGLGTRAVINLSPSIIITKGNGTSETPYEVIMK